MSLIQQLKQAQDFTEREKDIARFVLEHPETIENMSSRELGHQCGFRDTVLSEAGRERVSGI